ncbi:MAG TPA: AAA family ATPase [Ktedonobacteraceae bacterium]
MLSSFVDPLLWLGQQERSVLPLVGRENEMQLIHTLLDTVLHDETVGTRALTIRGEMGVGKSRLLAEIYTQAQTMGFRVIEGRAYESGNLFPYFPFVEALRPALRTLSAEQLRHHLGLSSQQKTAKQEHPSTTHGDAYKAKDEIISFVGTPLIAALAHLFPTLPTLLDVTITTEQLFPEQEKFRLFDAVATLLERMALDQPILLGIDNLQWADSASLELTMYLTMRLHQSRVALIGVTRFPGGPNQWSSTDRPTPTVTMVKMLGELVRQRLLMILPLAPLDTSAAIQHLQHLLPGKRDEHLEQILLTRAGGNPFFLEELVRALTHNRAIIQQDDRWLPTRSIEIELPNDIQLAVKQRLQELSQACLHILRTASLFGQTFPIDALLRVNSNTNQTDPRDLSPSVGAQFTVCPLGIAPSFGITPPSGIAPTLPQNSALLIDEAVQAGIITLIPDTAREHKDVLLDPMEFTSPSPIYTFCQGIVQEVLRTEIPSHRLPELHRAIGKALEATYGQQADAHAVELARHALLGGDKAAALHWSLSAGREAAQQLAYREAIGHFQLVLKLLENGESSPTAPSPTQLATMIGDFWFKQGELEQAEQTFLQAISLLQHDSSSADASLDLSRVNRHLADIYRMQGKYDLARSYLQAASNAISEDHQDQQATNGSNGQLIESDASIVDFWSQDRRSQLDRHRSPAEQEKLAERIQLLQAQATLDLLLNRVKEADVALWQSHQLATDIGDRNSQAFALHLAGYLRGWGEHITEAIRLQTQALQIYISIGDPFRAVLGEQLLGAIYLVLGEVEQASMYTQRGFERARSYGVLTHLGWLHWNFSVIALTHGQWTDSAAHLQEAEFSQAPRLKPVLLQTKAELAFRQGRWQEANQYFQESMQTAIHTEWLPSSLALYGHFLAVTGHHTTARTQLDKAATHPELPGYAGDFYIPFLAEGYLHLEIYDKATTYVERIRTLRGFMYYGYSVDRILGIVAAQAENWSLAEQAFEDGLALCRRANNQPEEATILYEQARVILMQSRTQPQPIQEQTLQRIQHLCDQAQQIFLQYGMQRYVDLVETVQSGVDLLNKQSRGEIIPKVSVSPPEQERDELLAPGYHLDLSLTARELEVLRLVAEGHTDREVADALVISPRTVNRHLSNIFVKLNVPGRAAAVAYAIRQMLV